MKYLRLARACPGAFAGTLGDQKYEYNIYYSIIISFSSSSSSATTTIVILTLLLFVVPAPDLVFV